MKNATNNAGPVLVLGIGNVLMGDEGLGVHLVRHLEQNPHPHIQYLDGGTGSFLLLEPMQQASRVILIDATIDGNPLGTIRRLKPRFSSDYPATLTAHDIGLKDLLDAAYLIGGELDVVLFAVSIGPLQELGTELSPVIIECMPELAKMVGEELLRGAAPHQGSAEQALYA